MSTDPGIAAHRNTAEIEKPDVEIRFIPILCSAPLLYAHSHGIFTRRGLNVNLSPAPGWSGVKELLVYGKVDAVHMPAPMPLACGLGIDGRKSEIQLAALQNVNGLALTLASRHEGITDVRDMKGFRFGVPYHFSMQYYLLCTLLAEAGIDPLRDVSIEEVAPPTIPYHIENDLVDGVFAPEPFNQIPVHRGTGFIFMLSKEIWDGHPCCCFATTRDFIDRYPGTYRAMLGGVVEAQKILHEAGEDERRSIAREISGPVHLDQMDPEPVEQALTGIFPDGRGAEHRVSDRIDFMPYPHVEYGVWMLTQMQRWGQLAGRVDYREVVESSFRTEDAHDVATALGFEPTRPTGHAAAILEKGDPFEPMLEEPFCSYREEAQALESLELPGPARQRLTEIIDTLARAAGGELDVQLDRTADGELGTLEQILGELLKNSRFTQQRLDQRNDELKKAQEGTLHLNAVLQAIRNVNQLITREKDLRRLIEGTCEELVGTRGFQGAWIATVNGSDAPAVFSASGYGPGTRVLREILQGAWPRCAQMSLGQEEPVLIRTPRTTCGDCPLAEHYGVSGAISARLAHEGTTYGVLTVSLPVDPAMENEDMDLVRELAGDLSFAMHGAEVEKQRRMAKEELHIKNIVWESGIAASSIADNDGVITHVNLAFLKLWGYDSTEDAIGNSVADFFVNPDDAGPVLGALGETGQWEGEFLAKRKGGEQFISRGFATVVKNERGEQIGYQSNNLDVTEQNQAAQKLVMHSRELKLRNRIAEVFLTVPDDEMYARVLEIILEGMESEFGVFGFVDEKGDLVIPTLTRLVWDKCQVPQKTFVFPRDSWGDSTWPRAMREKRMIHLNETSTRTPVGHIQITRHISMPIVHRDASIGLIQVANKGTDYDEGDLRLFQTIGDAIAPVLDARLRRESEEAERRQAKAELHETLEALERSNDDLEKFAYVASHDLQEPLRMVASYLQLIEQRYGDSLDDDAHEFIDYAVDGATRMKEMINDLLSYSRVGTKGRPFERVDGEKVLELAMRNLEIAVGDSGAEVTHDELPVIHGDETQLVQLFQNLLENAMKFRAGDAPQIHVSARRASAETVFSVRDNGPGIEHEYHDRIFVIFQRLNSTEKERGTGIGLAMCKKIIERHRGRIWIESVPGEGSTFHFAIPNMEEGKPQ